MMLLDEPYRFAEAIANRRDYIEDQLRGGSPVVGLAFADGLLVVTLRGGSQKLFEAYDRIGLGSVGHPTDIEKLRQSAVDLAHVIGFNYSDTDVTLQQIVHFGLGPAVKTSFDDVIRSPYIARVLLAELGWADAESSFYTVDYDGTFNRFEGAAAIGGLPESDGIMRDHMLEANPANHSLEAAVSLALEAWGIGRWVGEQDSLPADDEDLKSASADADTAAPLRDGLQTLEIEAAVLDPSLTGKSKFRHVKAEEIESVLASIKG